MSDSTIDDALKLLETGKGNPDRLKKIIESLSILINRDLDLFSSKINQN